LEIINYESSLYRRTCGLSKLVWVLKVGGQLAMFYIHQINGVNSRNGVHVIIISIFLN